MAVTVAPVPLAPVPLASVPLASVPLAPVRMCSLLGRVLLQNTPLDLLILLQILEEEMMEEYIDAD